jgi:hypothetical protein
MQRVVLGLLFGRKRRVERSFSLALNRQTLPVQRADLRGQRVDLGNIVFLDGSTQRSLRRVHVGLNVFARGAGSGIDGSSLRLLPSAERQKRGHGSNVHVGARAAVMGTLRKHRGRNEEKRGKQCLHVSINPLCGKACGKEVVKHEVFQEAAIVEGKAGFKIPACSREVFQLLLRGGRPRGAGAAGTSTKFSSTFLGRAFNLAAVNAARTLS